MFPPTEGEDDRIFPEHDEDACESTPFRLWVELYGNIALEWVEEQSMLTLCNEI